MLVWKSRLCGNGGMAHRSSFGIVRARVGGLGKGVDHSPGGEDSGNKKSKWRATPFWPRDGGGSMVRVAGCERAAL